MFLFVLVLVLGVGQVILAQEPGSDDISIGRRFTIRSGVLSEEREYWVSLPPSYYDGTYGRHPYPVLYLLDAESHFSTAAGIIRKMADLENLQIPEMIVVGIPNTQRIRDLTPTASRTGGSGEDEPSFASSGGGDNFLRFITDELSPALAARYRTRPYSILVGHSLGGLLALHSVVRSPAMFNAYIAIDPSLWWDKRFLANNAARNLTEPKRPVAVYIASAARTDSVVDDSGIMDPPIRQFADLLAQRRGGRIRSRYQHFDREDHPSVPLIGLYEGLRFIFEGYKPFIREVHASPSELEAHFARVSGILGAAFYAPEPFTARLGTTMLDQRDYKTAIEFFRVNTSHFPDSFHAFDQLADAYRLNGDTALAIENYRRSLTLDPQNKNAAKWLPQLRTSR